MFTRTRLAVATLAAATLPLAGFVLADVPHGFSLPGAAVAHAETDTLIPDTGNLHVHKRIGLPGTTRDDGTLNPDAPGEAVNGVGFTVYRVLDKDGETPLDLTTQDGWAAAQGVTLGEVYADGAPVATRVGTGQVGATEGDGTAVFKDLAAGLYLVVEEDNPVAEGKALAPAAPFLVTVPMTNPGGNGWLSDVHVYPKNQAVDGPVKTVTDPDTKQPGASVGEQIGFQIDTTIPKITPGNTFNGFLVTDKLPAGLGQPNVTVELVEQGEQNVTALTEGSDYTLTSYEVDGQWVVRVQLTGDTLSGLHNRSGQVLQVNLVSEVKSVPAGGVLENTAWVLPNNPGAFPEGWDPEDWDPENPGDGPNPGNESNTTRSVYGEITIKKTDEAGAALDGATFELYRCIVETTDPIEVVGDPIGDPIKVDDETQFTTATEGDNEGQVVISGIHLANLQPGQDSGVGEDVWAGEDKTTFCLVETKAPNGYSLLPQPFPVTLTATGTEKALVTAEASIQNVKTNAGFDLPLTGGRGIWALIGGGVLLLLLAAAYYMKTRRSTGSAD